MHKEADHLNLKIIEDGNTLLDLYPYLKNGICGVIDNINNAFYPGVGIFQIGNIIASNPPMCGGGKLLIINILCSDSRERRIAA